MKGENYTNKIKEYLVKNLKKGYTKESLRQALITQGHSRSEIDRAIKKLEEEMASDAPVLKTKPEITRTILDEKNKPIHVETNKKPFWKKLFG